MHILYTCMYTVYASRLTFYLPICLPTHLSGNFIYYSLNNSTLHKQNPITKKALTMCHNSLTEKKAKGKGTFISSNVTSTLTRIWNNTF